MCGLSAATILRAREGSVIPNRKTLTAIARATNGQVSVANLIQVTDATDASPPANQLRGTSRRA